MLSLDYTQNILGIKDIIITKQEFNSHENQFIFHIEMPLAEQQCPVCNHTTKRVHDYRKQFIKDIPIQFGISTRLLYRKRRYVCTHCGKRFAEQNTFLPRYYRMSSKVIAHIVEKLKTTHSIKDLAAELFLSHSTTARFLRILSPSKPTALPTILSIDEFKGNSGGEKFHCILTNPSKKKVLDILPSRTLRDLTEYFTAFELKEREQVQYFVMDMYKPYRVLAGTVFPNAKIIADPFHVIRQCMWSMENVRKRIQKDLPPHLRKFFKRSRWILLSDSSKLRGQEDILAQRDTMFSLSDELGQAYYLKEHFMKIWNASTRNEAKFLLDGWIVAAKNSGIEEFKSSITAFTNWHTEILNAIEFRHSNGFTEGTNNKIKVIKRNAYGYRNFTHFRTRILLCTN